MTLTPLLFDMDGLLLDTERIACESFVEVAEAFGLADPEAFFLTLVGSSSTQTSERIAEALGRQADIPAFKRRWGQGFEERIATKVPTRPGVDEIIPALAERGFAMVVVTSTNSVAAREQLGRAGLMQHFRDLVGGDMVSAHKPQPEPYLEGARRAGAAATECFAFEDSDMGVAAAVAAGCRAWQVPNLRPSGVPLPDLAQRVAPDLATAIRETGLLDV